MRPDERNAISLLKERGYMIRKLVKRDGIFLVRWPRTGGGYNYSLRMTMFKRLGIRQDYEVAQINESDLKWNPVESEATP